MSPNEPADALSFVLATHDVAPHVASTLDSLLAAAEPGDELIVVDDGSRDDTPDRVAAHPASAAGRLRLVRQPNQGVATTRLNGLRAASRPYVLFFDGDDQLLPGALAEVRAALRRHAPDIVLFDFEFWWDEPTPRIEPSPPRSHPPWRVLHEPEAWLVQTYDDAISSLWSRIARRSLYEAVLPRHCPRWSIYEDLAVAPHVLAAARSLLYMPRPVVKYRQRGGALSAIRSIDACENLVRSALVAADARAALPGSIAVADAAWRMVARKLVEAVRRAGEAGASADDMLDRLVRPVRQAMGAELGRIRHQLAASDRPGDRKVAAHLWQIQRAPRTYAALRAWQARLRQRPRR